MVEEVLHGFKGIECKAIAHIEENFSKPVILFLHGYSFTGETWSKTGVFDALTSRRYSFIAPDMPYGRRTRCTKHTRSLDINLGLLNSLVSSYVGRRQLVVVGASLGGRLAIYYSAKNELVRGLLLLSPYIEKDKTALTIASSITAVSKIILGEKDIVSRKTIEKLASRIGASIVVYEGAGHAMYLDSPDRFVRDLLEFIEYVEGMHKE
ncbi:MAG: alpha/beta hydrolase [Desulfurococcales archaeon]|nr:alpha/beta hydrolase [Desulfurococcales archaeon]MEB3789015.1 alpha/beta hydrolase [Desulfurococcales archaeon]